VSGQPTTGYFDNTGSIKTLQSDIDIVPTTVAHLK
jgi:hypothetical protein